MVALSPRIRISQFPLARSTRPAYAPLAGRSLNQAWKSEDAAERNARMGRLPLAQIQLEQARIYRARSWVRWPPLSDPLATGEG